VRVGRAAIAIAIAIGQEAITIAQDRASTENRAAIVLERRLQCLRGQPQVTGRPMTDDKSETNETSVLISLRELVALEDERVHEEEQQRAGAMRQAEAAAERARLEAAEAERARHEAEQAHRATIAQQQAEHRARLDALKIAEIEKARIEARAAAQQAAVQAQQIHERELAAHDVIRRSSHMKMMGLGVAFAAVLGAGTLGFWALRPAPATEDPRIAQLESQQQQLLRDRLVALDAFGGRLSNSQAKLDKTPSDVTSANAAVARTRAAVDSDGLGDARLDAYDEALRRYADELGHAHRATRLRALSAVHDKLVSRVDKMRHVKTNLKAAVKQTEARRRAVDPAEPADDALEAYDRALEKLGLMLADAPAIAGLPRPATSATTTTTTGTTKVCDYHDPLCDRLE
jgi:colicin import membrane protein